jgi:photosystem II stability/assembly factor-like uncharacterized protein
VKIFYAAWLVCSIVVFSIVAAEEKKEILPFIHNSGIIVHPENSSVVYASFWIYGVYKSTDFGQTWTSMNRGFKNPSVYTMKMDPLNPEVLMAGTHAGGIYRTNNGGKSWFEINTGLTNTTILDLVFDLKDSKRIYALTSLGLFLSENGGDQWGLLPGGIPGPVPDQQMTLLMVPPNRSRPGFLLLQNGGNLFRRQGDFSLEKGFSSFWSKPLLKEVTRVRALPLAYDSKTGTLYSGTRKGFMKSLNDGKTWNPLSPEITNANWLVVHPKKPEFLYLGTDGKGMFKTVDGGNHYQAINKGIEGPTSRKIFGLAIDPKNGERLYAASHSIGLFITQNGGERWRSPKDFPIPGLSYISAQSKEYVIKAKTQAQPPPPDFKIHCNGCHGWTDPALDFKNRAVWRAAPTPRDWKNTVDRMGTLAGIQDPQKKVITLYLNTQFGIP